LGWEFLSIFVLKFCRGNFFPQKFSQISPHSLKIHFSKISPTLTFWLQKKMTKLVPPPPQKKIKIIIIIKNPLLAINHHWWKLNHDIGFQVGPKVHKGTKTHRCRTNLLHMYCHCFPTYWQRYIKKRRVRSGFF